MELAEFFRVRRVLTWYFGLIVLMVTLIVVFSADIDFGSPERGNVHQAILSGFLAFATIIGAIVASWIGLALNNQNDRLELLWTRPISRVAIALRFIGIDLAALAIAYLIVLGTAVFMSTYKGIPVVVDPYAPGMLLLSTGVVTMWYAVLLAATAGLGRRGAVVAGLAWPASIFLIMSALGTRPGPLHTIVMAVNVLNPFAYLTALVSTDTGPMGSLWQVPPLERGIAAWLLAALLCSLAVWIWKRREV